MYDAFRFGRNRIITPKGFGRQFCMGCGRTAVHPETKTGDRSQREDHLLTLGDRMSHSLNLPQVTSLLKSRDPDGPGYSGGRCEISMVIQPRNFIQVAVSSVDDGGPSERHTLSAKMIRTTREHPNNFPANLRIDQWRASRFPPAVRSHE